MYLILFKNKGQITFSQQFKTASSTWTYAGGTAKSPISNPKWPKPVSYTKNFNRLLRSEIFSRLFYLLLGCFAAFWETSSESGCGKSQMLCDGQRPICKPYLKRYKHKYVYSREMANKFYDLSSVKK